MLRPLLVETSCQLYQQPESFGALQFGAGCGYSGQAWQGKVAGMSGTELLLLRCYTVHENEGFDT